MRSLKINTVFKLNSKFSTVSDLGHQSHMYFAKYKMIILHIPAKIPAVDTLLGSGKGMLPKCL